MAWTTQKPNGKWMGVYRKDGKKVSAGTYRTQAEALAAAEMAETGSVGGAVWEPGMTLSDYWDHWCGEKHVAVGTVQGYRSVWRTIIEPALGARIVGSISRSDVRQLILPLIADGRAARAVKVKAVIGSLYKPLVDEDKIEVNPARGIRIKNADPDPFPMVGPALFKAIHAQLPTPGARIFAEVLVGSGLRFGEAIELRVNDLETTTRELQVRRRACRVGVAEGKGARYEVVPSTKGGRKRTVVLSPTLVAALVRHIADHGLGRDDLVFRRDIVVPNSRAVVVAVDVDEGAVFQHGTRNYRHGTTTAYRLTKCRCDYCRAANRAYQASVRAKTGKPTRAVASVDTGHLSHEAWHRVWKTAQRAAGVSETVRSHDLRHAHATTLVASGVDIYEVKERMGHRSITTTEIYLHRVKNVQSKAADAADAFFN